MKQWKIQIQQPSIERTSQNSIITKQDEKEEFWVPIPYIGNISNKVGGYLRRKLKWKVAFTPGTKIINKLRSLTSLSLRFSKYSIKHPIDSKNSRKR